MALQRYGAIRELVLTWPHEAQWTLLTEADPSVEAVTAGLHDF